jgi:hypothetical protein
VPRRDGTDSNVESEELFEGADNLDLGIVGSE